MDLKHSNKVCYIRKTNISKSFNYRFFFFLFGVKVSTEQVGVTPALRRRREKAERQRALLRDQEGEAAARALSPLQTVEDVGNDLRNINISHYN